VSPKQESGGLAFWKNEKDEIYNRLQLIVPLGKYGKALRLTPDVSELAQQ
jgi:uncharacterized protein YeaC (DUF1315 family)